ncbi:major facilitator superfamily domain-containing protein, partial [Suillus americanus]
RTPLPWDQSWIILFSQLSDPLSSKTLVSSSMIRDTGVTRGDESQVGRYVGILQSSYYAANALTVFHWSRLSDHVGRKPVILTALLAISVSMVSFGLSKTFLGLVLSRAVCGVFNGSNSVIESMVMDITDVTNMPMAYSYAPLPFMASRPLIGGSLSRPADRFPDIFGRSELLKIYPYIPPCSISMIFVSAAWLVTYFCLKEVCVCDVEQLYLDHTRCGNRSVSTRTLPWELIKGFFRQSHAKPHQPSSNVLVNPAEANPGEDRSKPLPLRALLTPNILTATASCATTGLFHIAFDSVLPVFYATPIELGGLSLDPPRIGAILAASGVAHGIFQLVSYARLHDHFGARAIQITGISSGIPIVILFPAINALARANGIGLAVWQCVAIQLALTISLTLCFPCSALLIRAAAPNRASLGVTNGIAQMFVAGARIIGPASAASVFSYSMEEGHDAWLVYYFLMAIVFLAVGASLLLPRDPSVWENHR